MIKILGLFIIFFSSTLFGFLMAYIKKQEIENMEKTLKELKIFCQKIRLGENKLEKILSENLRENSYKNFPKEERKILEELFMNFGLRDKNSEFERTKIFIERYENLLMEKSEKQMPLLKLYKTLGVLMGAFICIFLI